MIAAYPLILGVPVLAVGIWLAGCERRRDTVPGLARVFAGTIPIRNALLDIVRPMP